MLEFPSEGAWAPQQVASQLTLHDTEFVAATFVDPKGKELVPLTVRPPVVFVIPVDVDRPATGTHLREFVGAKITAGETPEAAAARKLRGEAGLAARRLMPIDLLQGAVVSGGYTSKRCFAFFAEGLSKVARGREDLQSPRTGCRSMRFPPSSCRSPRPAAMPSCWPGS